jgi:UPF0176 protein
MSTNSFLVLAYYQFTSIPNPQQEVLEHKNFLKDRQITCRIYISETGINGQLSGTCEDAEAYMQWIKEHALFNKIFFKIHTYHENVFPRQVVKYRKQLVALDEEIDFAQAGEHVSPQQWKKLLENEETPLLLDIRNDYEWKVGRFQGAECPPCETFRQFRSYAEQLKNSADKKRPVMMYCTGGIRCELYSALLRKEGFEKVYQLSGGIINYGLEEGTTHWLGKLFVFDDRLTVPIAQEESSVIGICHHCDASIESYYNCANVECNDLFLCCPTCLTTFKGCCSSDCMSAPRVRPHQPQDMHKPFRKWHHYSESKLGEKV